MINELIKEMNESGCGYISLVNSIFVNYANDPEGFKDKFGFNMCDENGNFMFPYLFGYVFFTNINEEFNPELFYDKEENRPILGGGGSVQGRQGILEILDIDNLQSDGIKYPVNSIDISVELERGNTVVISINPVVMYKPNGEPYCEWIDATAGGHAMIVTGVQENGDLVVSSWGNQYIIKASEFNLYEQTYDESKEEKAVDNPTFSGFIFCEVYA